MQKRRAEWHSSATSFPVNPFSQSVLRRIISPIADKKTKSSLDKM
jgi:hypothetical protein